MYFFGGLDRRHTQQCFLGGVEGLGFPKVLGCNCSAFDTNRFPYGFGTGRSPLFLGVLNGSLRSPKILGVLQKVTKQSSLPLQNTPQEAHRKLTTERSKAFSGVGVGGVEVICHLIYIRDL